MAKRFPVLTAGFGFCILDEPFGRLPRIYRDHPAVHSRNGVWERQYRRGKGIALIDRNPEAVFEAVDSLFVIADGDTFLWKAVKTW